MNHKNNIVKKPWGYEYLVYENENVALWYLHIDKDQQTSMHCHPKKTTGLIVLNGEAEVSFLADKRKLKGLDKVMIRRGLFHQTKALSEGGIDLFEIETPNDKNDLVRLRDNYGRENKHYEGAEFETPKDTKCLWLEDKPSYNRLKRSNIYVTKFEFDKISDNEIIVFLRGGMVRNIDGKEHLVTIPGDVGFGKIIKEVYPQLDGVTQDTLIMSIRNDF